MLRTTAHKLYIFLAYVNDLTPSVCRAARFRDLGYSNASTASRHTEGVNTYKFI